MSPFPPVGPTVHLVVSRPHLGKATQPSPTVFRRRSIHLLVLPRSITPSKPSPYIILSSGESSKDSFPLTLSHHPPRSGVLPKFCFWPKESFMTILVFVKPSSLQGPSGAVDEGNFQPGSSRSLATPLGEVLRLNIQLSLARI